MNYPSDFPSCIKLNYSVSSHHFSFFSAVKWKLPACRSTSQLLVCPSVSNCLPSVRLPVCQPSRLANCQMMRWDREGVHSGGNWFCCCFYPMCWDCGTCSVTPEEENSKYKWGKDAIHGCSTTLLPQSTKTFKARGKLYKLSNVRTRHTRVQADATGPWISYCINWTKNRPADAQIWHQHTHTFSVNWTC